MPKNLPASTTELRPPPRFTPADFPVDEFRARLQPWYRQHARVLPWRGIADPYATWISEVMLQQTRVATVVDRYREFLERFPTVAALGTAEPDNVLAMWSGLGYYARARNMHRAAQVVARDLGGKMPGTARLLRTLPGVGEYTAAAIASIAFGENVAVVDGNVERVLLRILGEPEDKSTAARRSIAATAQSLMPDTPKTRTANLAGEHNQAMMELGATVCLPRAPLCLQCPVVELCQTRGEHVTAPRAKLRSRHVAYLLTTRKRGVLTEVLLELRPPEATQMPSMLELPPLPLDAVEGLEPALRLRHGITTTNYMVEIFTESSRALQQNIPAARSDLHWVAASQLASRPLTGLARKVLQKLKVMERQQVV